MDRDVLDDLTRPRRIAIALTLFLALGGFAGFVVGAAVAADEPALPSSFAFAAPMVGDRGHYEITGGPMPGTRDATAFDFEVLPDVQGADEFGRARLMNRVNVVERPNDDPFHTTTVHRIDALTGEPVAEERGLQKSELDEGQVQSRDYIAIDFATDDSGWAPPCGLRHELQGTLWDLRARPATFACSRGPDLRSDAAWTWIATGVADVDGVPHLRAALTVQGRERLAYEFRADVPYPLSIEYSGGLRANLTAFERGSGPTIALSGPVAGPPAPALEQRPLTPWLVDDSGLEHPFPLSKAWALAHDDPVDPAFRDFLAAHPQAYLQKAWYGESYVDGEGPGRAWRFVVTDQDRALDVRIGEPVASQPQAPANATDDPVGTVRDLVLGSTPPAEEPEASYEADEEEADDDVLDPAVLPTTLPSVASMVAQWRLHVGPERKDAPGHYLHVNVGCGETCTDYDLRLYVGSSVSFRTGDESRSEMSTLEWWMFPERFPESVTIPGRYAEDVSTWGPPTPTTQAAPRQALPRQLAATTPLWSMPGAGVTAGVGATAAVAALAYWLWPLVKGGGIGLFSRVHKDRLLDNPLRAQLVSRIEAEPGIHHNALVRDLGKGKGAAEHHLDKLVASRLVLRHRSPGYTCYFPAGTDHRSMAASPATKADGARRILDALRAGASGVREVAASTGLAPSTVSHHLDRLRAAGLVTGSGQAGYHVVPGAGAGTFAAA